MVDPVSAAAGAAVGAAVVGAAGKVVKAAAKKPKGQSIINAALLPPATVLGEQMAAWLTDAFQRGQAKRAENLRAHLDEAVRIGGQERLDAIADDPSFSEWIEEVSKVDPADEELSAIWQAALNGLREGGAERLKLLSIAKSLRPDEAVALVMFARKRRKLFSPYRRRLIDSGLVTTPFLLISSGRALVTTVFVWIVSTISFLALFYGMIIMSLALSNADYFYLLAVLILMTMIAITILYLMAQRPMLTGTGKALTTFARGVGGVV